MRTTFDNSRPIYLQIIDDLRAQIASGRLSPGEKLLPVRELALAAEVNPNTMQRALSELERDGLLLSQRTAGRFVTEDFGRIKSLADELARRKIFAMLRALEELGLSKNERNAIIRLCLEEDDERDADN